MAENAQNNAQELPANAQGQIPAQEQGPIPAQEQGPAPVAGNLDPQMALQQVGQEANPAQAALLHRIVQEYMTLYGRVSSLEKGRHEILDLGPLIILEIQRKFRKF